MTDNECHVEELAAATLSLMRAIAADLKLEQLDCFSFVKEMACCACGNLRSTPHHLKSQGSGGSNTIDNLLPLCDLHHDLIHKIGLTSFLEKFPQIKMYLEVIGFDYECKSFN